MTAAPTEPDRSAPNRRFDALLEALTPGAKLEAAQDRPDPTRASTRPPTTKARQARQLHELDRHNQQLLVESPTSAASS